MSKKQIKKIDVDQDIVKPIKKKNKHIVLKVLLVIIIVIILFFSYSFIKQKLYQTRSQKMTEEVNEIQKDKVDYVFIEINPFLVLTIKDGTVEDVACLNDDCVSIYNEIKIAGKNIDDSIDYLYDLAKSKGFDTSNGVKVRATGNVNIEKKDYVIVEYISVADKEVLLADLKNNESIKNSNNEGYYTTLWDKLKADGDYGDVYSCSMNNEELECYFTEKFISNIFDEKQLVLDYVGLENQINKFFNTLDKFRIKHTKKDDTEYISINYNEYVATGSIQIEDKEILANVLSRKIGHQNSSSSYEECLLADTYEYVDLKDFNLLNPNDANKIKRYTPERVIKDCKEVEMINNCLTGNGPCDLE